MDIFGAADGGGVGVKKASLPNICHAYPTIKLGTLIPYLMKTQNHVTHPLSSADISVSSLEIRNFYYIKKYRYRWHFNT